MSMQLDDWVLCRIYNKKGTLEKYNNVDQIQNSIEFQEDKPRIIGFGQSETARKSNPPPMQPNVQQTRNDYLHFETSESVPRLHTDSSGSEQVLSPDFQCEKEVQSAPKWDELERTLDYQMNFMDSFQNDDDPFGSQMQYHQHFSSPFQDVFMYMQKPF